MAHSLVHLALAAVAVLAVLLLDPAAGQAATATCDVCTADGWFPPSGAAAGDNCQTQYCVCYAPYTDVTDPNAAAGTSGAWLYTCPAGAGTATCFSQITKKCTTCPATC
ncbi:hypothetical protein FOCC_FOCC015255 [Frankliniella occidentalis]|uniref:Uncharacterized protein LOC127751177 n=1 Tax=Frankliniella occidentalis TaxID=133901 RepID=A0A9C6X706_FRAOC|nr:uncharacterized protein LOC127751177 [Frankliniella occidentalis]KAE8739239.1 hypothetical protein FOCC_FOCC015255 [Frankliniella occidentalis]